MSRNDISDFLIHFTKNSEYEPAFKILCKIISESRLIGGNEFIRGKFPCVCFSEAPISALQNGLINKGYYSKYSPFGIMVTKQWLFDKGGRPVIYQSDSEYDFLSIYQKWRHVRYEPPNIDFSWEREWRIQCHILPIFQNVASIVVLNEEWANSLITYLNYKSNFPINPYNSFINNYHSTQFVQSPQWNIITLQ